MLDLIYANRIRPTISDVGVAAVSNARLQRGRLSPHDDAPLAPKSLLGASAAFLRSPSGALGQKAEAIYQEAR